MLNRYIKLFALIMPITSILIFPQIQGTTPGLMMALLSPMAVFIENKGSKRRYWEGFVIFIYFFVFMFFASQLSLLIGDHGSAADLVLIRRGPLDPLRITIFTQGLYLLSGYLTFVLFATYYSEKLDRYIVAGGVLIATIGLAEWIYFLATGSDFSFLSNRTFGEDKDYFGSSSQLITIMGHSLLRLKSLTGEPSMYALTAFPYMIFCFARCRYMTGAYICFTLLLSTSTSAMLGFVLFGIFMVLFYVKGVVSKTLSFVILVCIFGILSFVFKDIVVSMIVEKLALEGVSGINRFFNMRTNLDFWLKSGVFVKMFGIGWGTIRSTDMFTTLLVNTGVTGLLLWLFLFLKPSIYVKRNESVPFILNLGIVTVMVMLFVAVSEYSYLSTWMFLGIVWNLVNIYSKQKDDYERGSFISCMTLPK